MSVFPTKILLATAGSEEAASASQTAAELTQRTASELHVVHVGETLGPGYSGYVGYEEGVLPSAQEELERRAQEVLEAQVERIAVAEGARVQSHLRLGRPDKEIVALGEEIGAGLIVIGSRGLGGMRRALMGSVSDSVVRHAHCPVMVVRGQRREEEEAVSTFPTKILLATDGSEEATLAASTAADLAAKTESELHVVHARGVPVYIDPSSEVPRVAHGTAEETVRREAQGIVDDQVKQIEAAGGKVARTHGKSGRPVEEIVILADEIGAGLVVIGSRGLGRIRRLLLGSVADGVVRHAHCPVMVVRKESSDR